MSLAPISPKEIAGEPTVINIKATSTHNTTLDKGKGINKTTVKENFVARNE